MAKRSEATVPSKVVGYVTRKKKGQLTRYPIMAGSAPSSVVDAETGEEITADVQE